MAPFPPTATCVLAMNADEYYGIQNHPAFRSLLAQVMDQEVEVLDVWYKDDVRFEKVINRPDYEKWVPKVGRRFVKPEDISFIDEMEYAPKTQESPPYEMKIKSLLPLMGDRVSIHRVVVISEEGPGTCRHTITGDVSVRVPAVGRMVEKYVMSNTVAAMNLLSTVVERYKKVQAQMAAEGGPPAQLPCELESILQAPYNGEEVPVDEAEEAPAQAAARETPKMVTAQKEPASEGRQHMLDSFEAEKGGAGTTAESKEKKLERATTRYFDAEEDPWEAVVEEEDFSDVLRRLDLLKEPIPDDEDDESAPRHGGRRHLSKEERRRRRKERARKFFTEIGSLSLSRRRLEARESGELLDLGSARSEEAVHWNKEKERWDKLWRGAKVRAAPIPKAFARVFAPLRILHSAVKGKVNPVSEEPSSSGTSSSADDPDQAASAEAADVEAAQFHRGLADASVEEQQTPRASRSGSGLSEKLRLKR